MKKVLGIVLALVLVMLAGCGESSSGVQFSAPSVSNSPKAEVKVQTTVNSVSLDGLYFGMTMDEVKEACKEGYPYETEKYGSTRLEISKPSYAGVLFSRAELSFEYNKLSRIELKNGVGDGKEISEILSDIDVQYEDVPQQIQGGTIMDSYLFATREIGIEYTDRENSGSVHVAPSHDNAISDKTYNENDFTSEEKIYIGKMNYYVSELQGCQRGIIGIYKAYKPDDLEQRKSLISYYQTIEDTCSTLLEVESPQRFSGAKEALLHMASSNGEFARDGIASTTGSANGHFDSLQRAADSSIRDYVAKLNDAL